MIEREVKHILSNQNGCNLYRGCLHGCIYCDSRSKCYHIDHEFTDVEVKVNAISLLEIELSKKKKPIMVGTGAMTDPYLPLEKTYQLTRGLLTLIDKYHHGLGLLTKSDLVLRDLDLLKSISKKSKCIVQMTITTFDENLCKILEPNVCTTKRRFEVLKILHENGITTGIWLCPILPFINDTKENIENILDACKEAHVSFIICFGMGVTLREGDREYFYRKLDEHFPYMKEKYIATYGNQYEVTSPNQKELMTLFYKRCKEYSIETNVDKIFQNLHTYEEKEKKKELVSLFDYDEKN